MSIKMITAMSPNNIIGVDGKLPWHLPEDLKYFKEQTEGHTVVMGRKTFESIGKLLPKRFNIILSRNGDTTVKDIIDLARFNPTMDIWIIGGAEIYKEFYPYCSELYITYVNDIYEGDAYFPIPIWKINEDFNLLSRKISERCEFLVMRRKYEEN